MTDIRNKSVKKLREMAHDRATITEIRPGAMKRITRERVTKAKPYNFMQSLIDEIERLRES